MYANDVLTLIHCVSALHAFRVKTLHATCNAPRQCLLIRHIVTFEFREHTHPHLLAQGLGRSTRILEHFGQYRFVEFLFEHS